MAYPTARGVAIELTARTDQARRDIARFNDDFGRGMKRSVSAATQAEGQIRRSNERIAASFRSTVGTIATAAGFIALAKNVATATREATAFEKGLSLVAGSSQEAARQTEELKRIANELGVTYRDLRDPFLQFAASAKGKGVDVIETFEAMTRAGVALGRSTEDQGRAFVALSQTLSKGKVTAEELTGQLAEALPGALDIAARGFGVTTRALLDLVADGGVPASLFVRKFTDQLQKEFPKGIEAADAGINRLRNTLNEALADTGDSGFFAELNKGADELATVLKDMNDNGSLAGVANGITGIATALIKLTGALGEFWKENPQAAGTLMGALGGAAFGSRFGPYGSVAGAAAGGYAGLRASEPTKDVKYYDRLITQKLSQVAAAELNGAGSNPYAEQAMRQLRSQISDARAARAALIAGGAEIPQGRGGAGPASGGGGGSGGGLSEALGGGKKKKGKKPKEFNPFFETNVEDVPRDLANAFENRFAPDPQIAAMLKEAAVAAKTLEERVSDADAAWDAMMNDPDAIAASQARIDELERAGDAAKVFNQDLSRGLADAVVYGGNLGDVLVDSFKRAGAAALEARIFDVLQGGGGGVGGSPFAALGSFIGGLFGKKRASGGHVSAGQMYRVNDGGLGIEGFQPAGSGKIIPLGQMSAVRPSGGVTVVQPLHFDARGAILTPELLAHIEQTAARHGQAAMVGGASLALTKRSRAVRQSLANR